MNTTNYVIIIFGAMISGMISCSGLINTLEKYLPIFIVRSFRYGKFACKKQSTFIPPIEVPKSWFKHFYIYSSFLTSFVLGLTIKIYLFEYAPPFWVINILNIIGGHFREANVTATHVLLSLILLIIQCVRRLYDTHFVSVFGVESKMNLVHYVVGFVHYSGAVAAILIEAPGYTARGIPIQISISNLNIYDHLATILFLWACYHQYKVTVILANLRKNKKGEIITQEHKIPHGDWFEFLSSPHLIAEILMYLSLTVILWGNITWLFVFLWVLSNQVETILLSHWWYQENFKEFPSTRKAFLPLIY